MGIDKGGKNTMKDALDELFIRTPRKCKCNSCRNPIDILLLSKGGETACYCKEHWKDGTWIKKQQLFKGWSFYNKQLYNVKVIEERWNWKRRGRL